MRLTEAISMIANDARRCGLPLPIILMPRFALLALARAIEEDIDGFFRFDAAAARGKVQYDGVTFAAMTAKPRIRVKAGSRVVGMNWTPEERRRFERTSRPPIRHSSLVKDWMTV